MRPISCKQLQLPLWEMPQHPGCNAFVYKQISETQIAMQLRKILAETWNRISCFPHLSPITYQIEGNAIRKHGLVEKAKMILQIAIFFRHRQKHSTLKNERTSPMFHKNLK